MIRLSAPATLEVTLKRRAGRRWITAVRSRSVKRPEGVSRLTIRTAHGRRLRAGRYRARLQATDAAGVKSAPRNLRFTLHR